MLALVSTAATAARADGLDQSNQMMFGVMGAYVPRQNDLDEDVAAVGHYVSYSHSLGMVYVGVRLAISYGWLPSGAAGQQFLIEPDTFVGLRFKIGKPLALQLEVGTGPLVNGGEGFATAIVDHTYTRGAVQWTVIKSVSLEAFAGPSFVIGPYTTGVFAEFGLGGGWSF